MEPLQGGTRYEVSQAIREGKRFARLQATRQRRKPERAARLVESREPLNFDETIAAKQRVMSDYYRSLGLSVAKFEAIPLLDGPETTNLSSEEDTPEAPKELLNDQSNIEDYASSQKPCEYLFDDSAKTEISMKKLECCNHVREISVEERLYYGRLSRDLAVQLSPEKKRRYFYSLQVKYRNLSLVEKEMSRYISDNTDTRILTLIGPPGAGKTSFIVNVRSNWWARLVAASRPALARC